VLSELRLDVIVHFVDVGGIVDNKNYYWHSYRKTEDIFGILSNKIVDYDFFSSCRSANGREEQ
jgi:hypothetical protein